MMLTGSEIICECLIEQGVDTVFGYPGGTILNVYDALYRYQDKINHVLTSHEQGASHAADGYARATGKVGVCMATSGPGATNLVTGIATAYMDSTPLVAITANVGVEILGRDSFQEIDITGVTMPITKHNFIVKDIKDLVPAIRKAFYIAKEGRPGPVLVDVTKNVTAEKMEFEPLQPKAIEPKTKPPLMPTLTSLKIRCRISFLLKFSSVRTLIVTAKDCVPTFPAMSSISDWKHTTIAICDTTPSNIPTTEETTSPRTKSTKSQGILFFMLSLRLSFKSSSAARPASFA